MQDVHNVGPTEVAAQMWRVALPLPYKRPKEINVYAIRDAGGDLHLIDSGYDSEEAWEALADGLAQIGHTIEDVRSVTVTHLHRDHRGLAQRVRHRSGAAVAMHERDVAAQYVSRAVSEDELDAWGVPHASRAAMRQATPIEQAPIDVDQVLSEGDELELPGRIARVMLTPGHTVGSICIAVPGDLVVLTGDHVLPDQFPAIGLMSNNTPGKDPLAESLRSLKRLSSMTGWTGLPGHGEPINDLTMRIQEIIRHHGRRTREVLEVRNARPDASVWETAEAVKWGSGWGGLSPWHRVSALRQTSMHLAHLRTLI